MTQLRLDPGNGFEPCKTPSSRRKAGKFRPRLQRNRTSNRETDPLEGSGLLRLVREKNETTTELPKAFEEERQTPSRSCRAVVRMCPESARMCPDCAEVGNVGHIKPQVFCAWRMNSKLYRSLMNGKLYRAREIDK
ncbi:hypothetical protein CRG98_029378 [Punica granatum]|uniref:Uncharacterized protein n=1 Tax=Punica granatum TaxID=22663 RepID=A0A2I0J253_PUNGR|nr:hypothetical protein CRG98_029378 [Punica granatum]